MSFKVRVRNFQAISDVELVIDGFTAVWGKNNTGKSSFIRAVQATFENPRGANFVRKGAKTCSVEVSFSEGSTLCWEKGKGVARYEVNGKKFNSVRGVPPEVAELGIRPVKAGDIKLWPQMGRQLSSPFLFEESGSVVAEAIADVERVGKLNRALVLSEKDRRAAVAKLKVRKEDLGKLRKGLLAYEGLDEVGETIRNLVKRREELRGLSAVIAELKLYQEERDQAQSILEELAAVDLVVVPEQDEVDSLIDIQGSIGWLRAVKEAKVQAEQEIEELSPIEAVRLPTLSCVDALKALFIETRHLQSLRQEASLQQARIRRTSSVESIGPIGEDDIGLLSLSRRSKALEALQSTRYEWIEAKGALKAVQEELETKEQELSGLGDIWSMVETCPTCGLSPECKCPACGISVEFGQ
jgi:hypothetical protein